MYPMPSFLATMPILETVDLGGAHPISAGSVAGFNMACQEEAQWCWAAVIQSLESLVGNDVSQSEVASRHIDVEGEGLICEHPLPTHDPLRMTCTTCKAGCSEPHSLGAILAERNLLIGDALVGPPTFDEIVRAITIDRRPLPVRVNWSGDQGHFICVTGYTVDAAGIQRVTVFDPLLPAIGAPVADPQDLRFDDLLNAYPAGDGSTGTSNYRYRVN